MKCSIDGCGRTHAAWGFCLRHYNSERSAGHLQLLTPEGRFWSHVDKTSGCWVWTGKLNGDGYARVTIGALGALLAKTSTTG